MSRSLQVSTTGPGSVQRARSYDGGTAPVRLTRRGRLLVLACLVVLLFGAFAFGRSSWASGDTPGDRGSAELVQTTVQPGDTLWALATRLAPGTDVRDVVAQIKDLNGLGTGTLQAGQQLLLPAPA